jgi:hypothetical protein
MTGVASKGNISFNGSPAILPDVGVNAVSVPLIWLLCGKGAPMAKGPPLVRDDDYEQMAASYQCVQIAALDAALQEHGVADAAVRQRICESFIFSMGNFHDQGWFKPSPDAKPVFPLLCFTETFLNTDTPLESLGQVYAPSPMFAFHEYAFGNIGIYFEGDPGAQVETGNFEGEANEPREPDTAY